MALNYDERTKISKNCTTFFFKGHGKFACFCLINVRTLSSLHCDLKCDSTKALVACVVIPNITIEFDHNRKTNLCGRLKLATFMMMYEN